MMRNADVLPTICEAQMKSVDFNAVSQPKTQKLRILNLTTGGVYTSVKA
jgi:hypothetical protein